MSDLSPHKIRILLRKWLQKKASSNEESLLHETAQSDRFLMDAMQGFEQQKGAHIKHIQQAQQRVEALYKTERKKTRIIGLMPRIAAAAAILLLGIIGIWLFQPNPPQDNTANVFKTTKPEIEPSTTSEKISPQQAPMAAITEKKNGVVPPKSTSQQNTTSSKKMESHPSNIVMTETTPNSEPIQKEIEEPRDIITATEQPAVEMLTMEAPPAVEEAEETFVQEEITEIANSEADEWGANYTDMPPPIKKETITAASSVRARKANVTPMQVTLVQGVVSDEQGNPLIGVSVIETNTNNGVLTDMDGIFELQATDVSHPLLVAYTGFQDYIFVANPNASNEIVLSKQIDLEEIQITDISTQNSIEPPLETIMTVYPTDGYEKYKKYIDENLLYPQSAAANQIEGEVTVQFQIQKDGRPNQVQITKSLGYGCDEEVIRLLEDGPQWTPPQKGKKKTTFTVKFKLDKKE